MIPTTIVILGLLSGAAEAAPKCRTLAEARRDHPASYLVRRAGCWQAGSPRRRAAARQKRLIESPPPLPLPAPAVVVVPPPRLWEPESLAQAPLDKWSERADVPQVGAVDLVRQRQAMAEVRVVAAPDEPTPWLAIGVFAAGCLWLSWMTWVAMRSINETGRAL